MREIRIRQMRYEEARRMLEDELNRAFVEGETRVSVLHGIGEGKLQKMTEELAESLNFVKIVPRNLIPGANPGMTYLDVLSADRSFMIRYFRPSD